MGLAPIGHQNARPLKGTLPCPIPTPMENTRQNSKNSKTLKTLDLGVSLLGYHLAKKQKQNLRIRAARIPAGTTSRSFRKSDFNNLRFMIRDICAQELHV
jgi:hypothetical protein